MQRADLLVAPPALEVCGGGRVVFLVQKGARDPTGAGIEILVGAPDSKVCPPVVQPELDVPDGVGQVPADGDTLAARRSSTQCELRSLLQATFMTFKAQSVFK